MNTDKRFLNYKKYDNFLLDLEHGNIPEESIVFIQDKGCIWARGKEYFGSNDSQSITNLDAAIKELAQIVLNKADKTEIPSVPVLATVATTGLYKDLKGTPTIPTKTSNLINDNNFLTAEDIEGLTPGGSSIDEKLINAKLQTLQEYLANQYVLKKDVQHPESEEWSEATIYPFGELPEADVDDTRKHVNIVAVDEDVFNPDDIQTDVCYFIYKKS